MRKALAIAAVAGLAGVASAQSFTLHFNAAETSVVTGQTIHWTVSVTGSFGAVDYLQAYDLNILAGQNDLGTASAFATAMSALVNPTGGAVSGASINGVSGGQSSILGPTTAGPITLGSFTVVASASTGYLDYTVADGGIFATTTGINIKPGSDFAPSTFDGIPGVASDRVGVNIPTPASAALMGLGGLVATRRRR
ncbi:MAG: hypothetical protein R3B49_11000 [Phycisphaerales bacterium]